MVKDQERLFGLSPVAWICVTLTLTLSAAVIIKIPIDTQFFTIVNSTIVAYVVHQIKEVQSQRHDERDKTNGHGKGPEKNINVTDSDVTVKQ